MEIPIIKLLIATVAEALGFHLHGIVGKDGYLNVYIGVDPMMSGGINASSTFYSI